MPQIFGLSDEENCVPEWLEGFFEILLDGALFSVSVYSRQQSKPSDQDITRMCLKNLGSIVTSYQ